MKSVTTRLATNADGPAIKVLLAATDQDLPVLFNDVAGYWRVAEWKGRGVGCIQVCYGRPMGSIEMMAIAEGLPGMIRVHAMRELLLDGMAMLHRHGATFVRGFVPFRLKGFKRAIKNKGAETADQGNMMVMRIGYR